jgi:undecaprenyl-diphosphatase
MASFTQTPDELAEAAKSKARVEPVGAVPPPLTVQSFRWLWPALLLAGASALAFAALLVVTIAKGKTLKLDTTLLLALRRPGHLDTPIGPSWLEQSAIDLSALGGFTLLWLLGAAAIGFLLYIRKRAEATWLAGSVIGASVLNAIFKLSLHRPRPELVTHLAKVSNASFPSGHAMVSAAIYLTVGAMLAETQSRVSAKAYLMGLAGILVLMIGASRIYLGVHWPSDVMAGWCFGSVWALLVFAANRALRRRAASRKIFTSGSAVTPATR